MESAVGTLGDVLAAEENEGDHGPLSRQATEVRLHSAGSLIAGEAPSCDSTHESQG